jgi:uncharacterized membrane protein YgcG
MNRYLPYKMLWLLAIIMLLSITPAPRSTTAQTAQPSGETDHIEYIGSIEAMDLKTLTINGAKIDISRARINTPLELKALVKVEASLMANGTVIAREVNSAQGDMQPDEIEVIGPVISITSASIVIGSQTIDTSTSASKPVLNPSEFVRVRVQIDQTGRWIAHNLEIIRVSEDRRRQIASGEFELTGTLEVLGLDFVVISGQRLVLSNTEIKGRLIVGALATAHVRLTNNQLVAREIERADRRNDNDNDNDNGNVNGNINGNVNSNRNTNRNANSNVNDNRNTNLNGNNNSNDNGNDNDDDDDDDDSSGRGSGGSGSGNSGSGGGSGSGGKGGDDNGK